jgi:quinol monooxygenase YgiN
MAKVELIVPVKAAAGKAQELQRAIAAVVAPTRAEQGCEFYRAYASDVEGNFFFHELWTSQQDLDRHAKSAHIQVFATTITPLLAEPLRIEKVQQFE